LIGLPFSFLSLHDPPKILGVLANVFFSFKSHFRPARNTHQLCCIISAKKFFPILRARASLLSLYAHSAPSSYVPVSARGGYRLLFLIRIPTCCTMQNAIRFLRPSRYMHTPAPPAKLYPWVSFSFTTKLKSFGGLVISARP